MSLDDASQKRKERLALLGATKRKRDASETQDTLSREAAQVSSTMKFRNYDPESNAPKLGFLHDPAADVETVERRAAELTQQVADEEAAQEGNDAPIDVLQIQARKPNWDLKRDLEARMQPLKARQEVTVARLVRERLQNL